MAQLHGGNIYHFAGKYGMAAEDILDFSASVNPLGPSPKAIGALRASGRGLANYPDPDCTALTAALAGSLEIRPGSVLAGNGSTELLYLLPRLIRPKRALVLAPAYSDYERASLIAGSRVRRLVLDEGAGFAVNMDRVRAALDGIDIFFLCNPNNPTGVLLKKGLALDVLKAAGRAGAFTVIDEAFIDYTPGCSLSRRAASSSGCAVLRNFTKFYGMPGIRAGYLISGPSVINGLKGMKEPWSVSVPAQAAALAAISDTAYIEKSLRLAGRERARLYRELGDIPGIKPYPPSANFILARLTGRVRSAGRLAEALAGEGILIRDCSNFAGLSGRFFRVSVRTRADNAVLAKALRRRVCFTRP